LAAAGVHLLSKLSTLKQEAYQAGKKKNWAQAIMLYEQILELEKNNPTIINELGDLCLKGDESQRAVRYFLSAASKYRTTGLLNNAVAIYKKILRHDGENLNAHWYLSETRANQGLIVEGENHAVHFLDNSENVSGDIKEIFLKRCQNLFELYPQSRVILSRLSQIFRMWSMNLEAARADCLLFCMDFAGGQEAESRQAIDDLTGKIPEVMNYPEFAKWNALANPEVAGSGTFSDFGTVSLSGDTEGETSPETAVVPAQTSQNTPETSFADVSVGGDSESDFGDLNLDGGTSGAPAVTEIPAIEPGRTDPKNDNTSPLLPEVNPASDELDDEGCFSIDDGPASTNFDDLIAEAAGDIPAAPSGAEVFAEPTAAPAPDPTAVLTESEGKGTANVDLLAQMLEEDGPDLVADSSGELATITAEIGSVVGGGEEDDAARLYEMGTVYLEMGMFDQACESFETAAADEDFCIRAHEMWGMALQRANRFDEAITVLRSGLEHATSGSHEYNGLMYHLGVALEKTGQSDKAIDCFRTINDVDPRFLDVGRRLAKLTAVPG